MLDSRDGHSLWGRKFSSVTVVGGIDGPSVVDDMRKFLPSDLPPIESTYHLSPLKLEPQFCMFNTSGGLINRIEGGKDGLTVTRINRSRLRDLLATNINIRWGMEPECIEEHEDKVTLHFRDGKSFSGDFLVGADGARSKGSLAVRTDPERCLTCLSSRSSLSRTKAPSSNANLCRQWGDSAKS